jgi:hypothetical protein
MKSVRALSYQRATVQLVFLHPETQFRRLLPTAAAVDELQAASLPLAIRAQDPEPGTALQHVRLATQRGFRR